MGLGQWVELVALGCAAALAARGLTMLASSVRAVNSAVSPPVVVAAVATAPSEVSVELDVRIDAAARTASPWDHVERVERVAGFVRSRFQPVSVESVTSRIDDDPYAAASA